MRSTSVQVGGGAAAAVIVDEPDDYYIPPEVRRTAHVFINDKSTKG